VSSSDLAFFKMSVFVFSLTVVLCMAYEKNAQCIKLCCLFSCKSPSIMNACGSNFSHIPMYRAVIALKMINRRNTPSILKALTKYCFWRLIRRHIFTRLPLARFRTFRSFFLKVFPNGIWRMLRKEGSKSRVHPELRKGCKGFWYF